jgi:glutaredoxin
MARKITVYGADWCEDTHRTRTLLDGLGVPYEYVDIDEDPQAEAWITQQNNGKRKTPTVDLGGSLLFEPSDEMMMAALRAERFIHDTPTN